jgi:anti-sigma factor RsiW
MNCEKIETKWIAYLDGKASAAERREVEAHLVACTACSPRRGVSRDVGRARRASADHAVGVV